ncbi:Abi-alpha family protein [Mycolicibacterium sp. CBMA 226]|uniref:Abi-alpha family protein n=1 Tax=Mycolicibacterium sp. CBMA 226 TaxID=2606611 RepID=UPI0012DD8DED|nr:Abi-alpha family protein [Mycolicibacterium sp. CBMA 226]MUL78722.1 DUF4393 domain-containing protein [Mycolicibacterium sp. CBMA 226]
MTNLLDPFGLADRAVDAARLSVRVAGWCEYQALTILRDRLAAIEPIPKASESTTGPAAISLHTKMRMLLDRALDQGTHDSHVELYHRLLDQLVADEARIVGALSDGSSSPTVNVHAWTKSIGAGHTVLTNASLVGRTANIALPQSCPHYIGHLLNLGLLEVGPEDPALKTEYEVLMAETMVLDAIKHASRGPLAARVEKLTVRLSGMGRDLWSATMEEDAR